MLKMDLQLIKLTGILQTDPEEWKPVFLLAAGVFATGNLLYILLGSGEEQDFNRIPGMSAHCVNTI